MVRLALLPVAMPAVARVSTRGSGSAGEEVTSILNAQLQMRPDADQGLPVEYDKLLNEAFHDLA